MVTAPKSAKEIEDENKEPEVVAKVEEPKQPTPEPEKIVVGETLTKLDDPVPAHWNLVADEGDIVIGTCSTSRKIFRGTVAEFNEALRNS